MKLLLVEDDEDKRNQILDFVSMKFKIDIQEVRSYQSALKAIRDEQYDLILLDMTMPTFDISSTEYGGRSLPFGGELLLFEMMRREVDSKVIVITQFDLFGEGDEEISLSDLDSRLKTKFENNYLGAIQYSISYTSWQDVLGEKIKTSELSF